MCVCRRIYNKACMWSPKDSSKELLLSLLHGIWGLHSSCTRSKHFYLLSHLTGPEDPFLLFICHFSDMEDVGEQKVGCSVVEQVSGTSENKYIKRKEKEMKIAFLEASWCILAAGCFQLLLSNLQSALLPLFLPSHVVVSERFDFSEPASVNWSMLSEFKASIYIYMYVCICWFVLISPLMYFLMVANLETQSRREGQEICGSRKGSLPWPHCKMWRKEKRGQRASSCVPKTA